ncbi:hypothetical protein [Micromonospora violae]|uniref:hypothetical protein n=1 Tax=Micromonospora violae TaxID=1278207 RepID=UPI0033D6E982
MTPLEQAARAAQHAPSVFNTQPWNWRISGAAMELFAEEDRRVATTYPLTVATEAACPVVVVPLDQREGDPL